MSGLDVNTARTSRNFLFEDEQAVLAKHRAKIVAELIKEISENDKAAIKSMTKDDLSRLHHSLGTGIRNGFRLWGPRHAVNKIYKRCEAEFPLEQQPFNYPEVDGTMHVDDHPCHPDNFSFTCIEQLWENLQ